MPAFEFKQLADAEPREPADGRLSWVSVDGAQVPGGSLSVWLGPKKIGGRYFRLLLGGRRFIQGLYNDGVYPGQNWAEIFDIDLPPDLEGKDEWASQLAPYLRPLADAVPPGGHLMVEYEKALWHTTQRGLLAGIPPLATPLGSLLFDLGTGDSFKDWYFPEGGQEGGRKLQGNKAHSPEQAAEMRGKRARQLRDFLASPVRGDPEIDERARRDAERVLRELEG
jgi:hypothetical protein